LFEDHEKKEYMDKTIFTLDARDNVRLEVLKGYFGLNEHQIYEEINGLFDGLIEILKSKKIDYEKLKSSLIPNSDKNEIVLVFDTLQIKSNWYGKEIFDQIIPVFENESSHSILTGDFIGKNNLAKKLFEEFSENLITHKKEIDYQTHGQFYLVFLNNLSLKMVNDFQSNLSKYEPFVGYFDLKYSSYLKTYFSTILCKSFIKHKRTIISGHEDDLSNDENCNMSGFSFEENGFTCKSLQSTYTDLFLSYKIEREVFSGFEDDTTFSINSISKNVFEIKDFKINVDEKKLQYLIENKEGILKKSGILNINTTELEKLILDRINENYIYNLTYLNNYDTVKFNILLEYKVPDKDSIVKLNVALEYIDTEKSLRLITMY
jgi:hypothetical protein